MKRALLFILCMLTIVSCTENKITEETTNKGQISLAQSIGKINELSVVIDNDLWQGKVGDTIRKYFGAEVPGLPQEEPLFSMRQMAPTAFKDIPKRYRLFLKIDKSSAVGLFKAKNKFATPQLGYVITGTSDTEIINLIKKHSETIISNYKKTEIKEKQYKISKSLEYIPQLKEKMGITMQIPSAYRIAKEEDKFFWLRKNITNGDMNLMIYELPYGSIVKDSNTIASIIRVRDSVGILKIPTNSGEFVTEKDYAPYLFETILDNNTAFETKGTWEIKDRFMAGPFVNYIIDDKANNRQLVVEGFVLAPSVQKRDNIFELEAIIKTIKF